MPDIRTFVVDAFTDRAFAGNPAAVCLLESQMDDAARLRIAAEINHSETAFVVAGASPNEYGLRWFTPKVEVDLCGHATLASAAVLFQEAGASGPSLRFHTRSGELVATREGKRIRLDFPANPPTLVDPPQGLLSALGVQGPLAVAHAPRARKLLVEVASPKEVRAVTPDFVALLKAKNDLGVKGIIVTSAGEDGFDFTSRYFAAWVGINEDPVTGAAHTVLGPYWAGKLGTKEFRARQDSSRGGQMDVRLVRDRVHMLGDAVIVLRGTLRV